MTRVDAYRQLLVYFNQAAGGRAGLKCTSCMATVMRAQAPEHFDVWFFKKTGKTAGYCRSDRDLISSEMLSRGAAIIREAGPRTAEDGDEPTLTTARIEAFRWISALVAWPKACADCGGAIDPKAPWEHFDVWQDMVGKYHSKCPSRRLWLLQYAGQGAAALKREAGPMTRQDTTQAFVQVTPTGKRVIPEYPHTCMCGSPGVELFQFFKCSARCGTPRRRF